MSRRPHIHPAAAALAVLAAAAAFLVAPAVAVAATSDPTPSRAAKAPAAPSAPGDDEPGPGLATFGLSAASGDRPDPRSYLAVAAAPGSVIYDAVAVVNQSDQPLDLDVYTADATNGEDGTLGLPDRSVPPADAGAWIAVDATRVTVPGQSADGPGFVVVPVAITIPVGAEPGEHVAGVVASLTSTGTAAGDGQSATVDLEQRVGLRVYVTVDGDLAPGLVVSDLRATYHTSPFVGLAGPGTATVTYTLTNTGNTRLTVRPDVAVTGPFGWALGRGAGDQIDELLPRASVDQTVEVPGVWPMVAERVTVTARLSAPVAGGSPDIAAPTASVWMWALPWAHLALLLLLAAGWWWARRRARRRPQRGRHSGTRPPARPAAPVTPTPEEARSARPQPVP